MKKLLLTAAAAVALATPAVAATDGPLSDSSSTGTLDVTANIAPMVSIRGLDDLTMTINAASILNPSSWAAIEVSNFCVYSNADAVGSYKIRVDGTAGSAAQRFALTGPGGNLDYRVHINDVNTTSPNGTQVSAGQTVNFQNTAGGQARATDRDCTNVGGNNSTLSVRVGDADALAAVAGSYTGTLSVVVSVP